MFFFKASVFNTNSFIASSIYDALFLYEAPLSTNLSNSGSIVCCIYLTRLLALSDKLDTALTTTEFICCILFAVSLLESASWRISSATTANPFPASPALAASIDAFNARRLVWLDILKISLVRLLTWSTLLLSSIALFSTSSISPTFSLVCSILFLALLSILSASSFICLENVLISFDFDAIISTSSRTLFALSLITLTDCPTSCIVADNSSVIADKSEALSLEAATLLSTASTTPSIRFVFSIISLSIP